jgi:hypothetical protein
MTIKDAVSKLYSRYHKYGLTKQQIHKLITSGITDYGLNVRRCFNGLRFAFGYEYGEQEQFTLSEVAEMLGTTESETKQAIEQVRLDDFKQGFTCLYYPTGKGQQ